MLIYFTNMIPFNLSTLDLTNVKSLVSEVNRVLSFPTFQEAGATDKHIANFIDNRRHFFIKQTGDRDVHHALHRLRERIAKEFPIESIRRKLLISDLIEICNRIFFFDFSLLPQDVILNIFQHLAGKRNTPKCRVQLTGLNRVKRVCKQMYLHSQIARKLLLNEQPVSLKKLGFENASQAVDFVIENQLNSANFEELWDLNDNDLKRLIDNCPYLTRLIINSDNITAESIGKIGHLKGLKELSVKGKHVTILDLAHMTNLEWLTCADCANLTKVSLPKQALKLQWIDCRGCKKLVELMMPEHAPELESIDCENCPISNLTLSETSQKLRSINCSGCFRMTTLKIPTRAPFLETIDGSGCYVLIDFRMPVHAPKLRSVEFTGCQFPVLTFPVDTPILRKINCVNCAFEIVVMPQHAPELYIVTFDECKLLSLTLPEKAPKLDWFSCCRCTQLTTLTMAKEAPELRVITFNNNMQLKDVSLPLRAEKLYQLYCNRCPKIVFLILPQHAPCLAVVESEYGDQLEVISMPEKTPELYCLKYTNCPQIKSVNMGNANPKAIIYKDKKRS